MRESPSHSPVLLARVREAFWDHGYEQMNMTGLAKACGFTRRALYHHFSNKEEAFQAVMRWVTEMPIRAGVEAGRRCLAEGGNAVDALTTVMDVRYGENRRRLSRSPHAVEINDMAFRLCRPMMNDMAMLFHTELALLIEEMLEQGLLRLKPRIGAATLAQMLSDGARGVNQSLPTQPSETLPARYRAIIDVILFGSADPGPR